MTSISPSQRSSRRDCQVLVVGAGPTGLVLACELLARGIRVRIIDKGDGVVLQTRALGIHALTLEVFDTMGLAERFPEHGQVVRRFHMYTDGKTLVRLELARNGSAFGFMLDVPQDVTETILRQRVSELGGRVDFRGHPYTQRLVGERAPEPVPVSDPAWLAIFQCQRRSTHVYRRARVMLAGDAVHIHSPAGGQGMNTGIVDAHNLAWKLALVASGHSPERLLDSYGQERGPVAADVLALTHALVKLGTMTHPVWRAFRNTFVPVAGRLAPIQRRAVRRMSHTGVAYVPSLLTYPDRNRTGVRPGRRAPDLQVTSNGQPTRLYEVLRRGRHILLMPAKTPAGTCRRA